MTPIGKPRKAAIHRAAGKLMTKLPIFIINLERDTERRRHMTEAVGSLGLVPEFITAVDGRRLSPSDRASYDHARSLRIYGAEMMDTEIACYLSHQRLYKRIVREGIDIALIMEDDIHIEPTLPVILQDLLACRFSDWLVIRLDCKRTQVRDPPSAKFHGTRLAELSDGAGLYRLRTHVLGLATYLIRREGAVRMLDYGQRIFMPIDMTMDRFWENGIVPYVVRPVPVRQLEEVFPASTGIRLPDRYRVQPFPIRLQRRVQRAIDGVRKRAFNLMY